MLILRQKSFQFCIPHLKTPQPVLPYDSRYGKQRKEQKREKVRDCQLDNDDERGIFRVIQDIWLIPCSASSSKPEKKEKKKVICLPPSLPFMCPSSSRFFAYNRRDAMNITMGPNSFCNHIGFHTKTSVNFFFSQNLGTFSFLTILLSYDSLPKNQCDGNFNILEVF